MKTTLTALLLFAFVPVAFSQIDPHSVMTTYVVRMNLRGPVKSVEHYWLIPGEGGAEAAPKHERTEHFNRHGWIISRDMTSNGIHESTTAYIQDRRGRPILSEKADPDRPVYYTRDRSGRITEQVEYITAMGRRKAIYRVVLAYDDRDNVTKRTIFSIAFDDRPERTDIYRYDAMNRVTFVETRDNNYKVAYRITREFDSNGILRKTTQGSDTTDSVAVSLFDERGRLVRSDSPEGYDIVTYDDEKFEKIHRSYAGSILLHTISYKLDKYGNLLAKVETMSDYMREKMAEMARAPESGFLPGLGAANALALSGMWDREKYGYEYDSRGNWTMRVEFGVREIVIGADNSNAELKPVRTQIRKITYFE